VHLHHLGDWLETVGLANRNHAEIRVALQAGDSLEDASAFLQAMELYVEKFGGPLGDGETLEYGYWQVQFRKVAPHVLEVWERTADASSYQRGIALTSAYWRDQMMLCTKYGVEFCPIGADRLVAVTPRALDDHSPLEGGRHEPDGDMSGWFLTGSDFAGNVSDFQILHLYHVTSKRPELAKFLALPEGYLFRLRGNEEHVGKIKSID
jgi:hypothetical protein